ncbi:MAG TPA: hypothetical protein VMF13_11320 [Luteitalea sp.]|nr:hypothetical protein [Luteitalea sp.]
MTAVKLQRERALAERRKEKEQRRARPKEATTSQQDSGGEDPDLAGIQLGPQPLQDWQRDE